MGWVGAQLSVHTINEWKELSGALLKIRSLKCGSEFANYFGNAFSRILSSLRSSVPIIENLHPSERSNSNNSNSGSIGSTITTGLWHEKENRQRYIT